MLCPFPHPRFAEKSGRERIPEEGEKGSPRLSDYEQDSETRLEQMKLRPYEAAIYEIV